MTMFGGLVLSFVVLHMTMDMGISSSIVLLQMLLGPLVYFGTVAANAPPPSRKTLMMVTVLFVFFAALELVTPGLYGTVAGMLLDRVTVADGHHGISLLTPEPTYAAIALIYLVLLSQWSRQADDKRYAWIEWIQIILLLLTMSTYALVFLLALVIVRWPRTCGILVAVLILLVPNIGILEAENTDSIRAVVAISRLLSSDFSNLLPSLSMLDPSLGSRLITNFASFQAPTFSLSGLGLDCQAVPNAFDALGYDFVASNEVLAGVMEAGCLKPQSYGAAMALGLGFLAIPCAILLAVAVRSSTRHDQRQNTVWKPALAIALIMLTVQIQLTNPIPWLLVYFALMKPPHRT